MTPLATTHDPFERFAPLAQVEVTELPPGVGMELFHLAEQLQDKEQAPCAEGEPA